MVNRTTISAVIPAFNSAAFLVDAVASIRAQTTPVSEIIVVDDGSTDDTSRVVSSLGSDIHLLRQKNAGPAAARNAGVTVAKGEFIAFLDADDQWTSQKNEKQLALFAKNPELGLIASDMAEIDSEGAILVPSMLDKHQLLGFFKDLDCRPVPDGLAALMRKNFIPTGTVMIRKTNFQKAGGFNSDIRYGEDLELWGRIAANHPVVCVPEVHMLRRRHEGNATSETAPMLADLVKVMRSIREWGGGKLKASGMDADLLVANALSDLGYWYFNGWELKEARKIFRESLSEKLTFRGLFYYFVCFMPVQLTKQLRRIKQTCQQNGIS